MSTAIAVEEEALVAAVGSETPEDFVGTTLGPMLGATLVRSTGPQPTVIKPSRLTNATQIAATRFRRCPPPAATQVSSPTGGGGAA
jgi:hypothetical protein